MRRPGLTEARAHPAAHAGAARHYLDHASTTPLRPEAVEAIRTWLDGPAADPGRLHREGRVVRAAVEEARELVATLLHVRPRQVVFTSGATEAINAATWGMARNRPGATILCADVEHSAVREASARLAPVTVVAADRLGRIDLASLGAALERTAEMPIALVQCQWANHEIGTIQPVAEVVAMARRSGVPVHVDAAAACGHVPLDLDELGADLVSLSAHKLGGPPGVGAMVVRRGVRIEPFLVGGQQERARRAGMENVPGIVGFGAAAAALAGPNLADEAQRARSQTDRLVADARAIPGVAQVGDPTGRLPHLVCIGVEGVEAEPVLLGLDRAGIAAHSGSACSSEALEPSPVLAAMGADPSHSLRLSVGWSTSDADVAAFGPAFSQIVGDLRALRR